MQNWFWPELVDQSQADSTHDPAGCQRIGNVYSAEQSLAAGQFLRGVLDKIGIEPQVQRIGRFKRWAAPHGCMTLFRPASMHLTLLHPDCCTCTRSLLAWSRAALQPLH